MLNVTATELHQKTGAVLDRVERGEIMTLSRNGNIIGYFEPAKPVEENKEPKHGEGTTTCSGSTKRA